MLIKKNLKQVFSTFDETWSPRIAGDINNIHLKLAKFEGEFIWHKHENEDELFMVIEGCLHMELRDQDDVIINPGEFLIVPKGIEHKPVAPGLTKVVLLEPKTTINTGDKKTARTIRNLKHISGKSFVKRI